MTDSRDTVTVHIEPKVEAERIKEVDTPWGRVAIEEGISFRTEWGYNTGEGSFQTPMGRASVSLRIDGEDGDPFPRFVRVVLLGGAEIWGVPKGEPLNLDGRLISWVASIHVDPLTGMPLTDKPLSVSLSKADAKPEERRFLGLAPGVDDKTLEAHIGDMAVGLVKRWAGESQYTRVFYGAVARIVQDQHEHEVEIARLAYIKAMAQRDEVHRSALTAEYGTKQFWELGEPVVPHRARIEGIPDGSAGDMKEVSLLDLHAPARVEIEVQGDTLTAMAWMQDGRHVTLNAMVRDNGTIDATMGMGDYDL